MAALEIGSGGPGWEGVVLFFPATNHCPNNYSFVLNHSG
jgi:hypothetical protein